MHQRHSPWTAKTDELGELSDCQIGGGLPTGPDASLNDAKDCMTGCTEEDIRLGMGGCELCRHSHQHGDDDDHDQRPRPSSPRPATTTVIMATVIMATITATIVIAVASNSCRLILMKTSRM